MHQMITCSWYCIVFYRNGDVTLLGIDAIVHPTNEKLTDRTSLSSSIYGKAGPKLLAELRNNIKGKI